MGTAGSVSYLFGRKGVVDLKVSADGRDEAELVAIEAGAEEFVFDEGILSVTCRPEDRAIGTAHWVQFQLTDEARRQLTSFSHRAYFSFENESYQHRTPSLGDDFRQSLLDDLLLSDRDGERRAG